LPSAGRSTNMLGIVRKLQVLDGLMGLVILPDTDAVVGHNVDNSSFRQG
jgi:hypothetical protein